MMATKLSYGSGPAPVLRPDRRITVAHVITTLSTGGAEIMLQKLLGTMDRDRFRSAVITLSGDGTVARKIRGMGFAVCSLGLRPQDAVSGLWRLARELRRLRPDIVQTWMYHADLFGSLASLTLPRIPVVWNVRCGRLDRAIDKRSTRWIAAACARASRALPARVVCCSRATFEAHAAAGYAAVKMRVIRNGFDTDVFRPDAMSRRAVREELGLAPETPLVGLIARFHAAKDHACFCKAAGIVSREMPHVHFLFCGDGVTPNNPQFAAFLKGVGSASRYHLLGPRDDIPRIMAALDVAASSSIVEGLPNAIGEAMSCAVPCVATDAGDSRFVIGETGCVVPPRDPEALAAGILKLLRLDREARTRLGARARSRIVEHFSLLACVRQYEELYQELAFGCAA